jgi:enoyl-CoA hydratase
MEHSFTALNVTRPKEHVLLMMLNRPSAANAMNTQLGMELMTFFETVNLDAGDTRCIVITGAGDRAFCAGADLKERKNMMDEAWTRQHLIYERMVRAILSCPLPIIAAVNGAAYGGGCELALACDFIYASEQARFALTEVTLGIMPGAGGTQTLARALGERRAKEIILTGKPFSASDAQQWGMVNRVVPPSDVVPHALVTA